MKKYIKSRLKVGDKVKIIKLPVEQSKYGNCLGYDHVGKTEVVTSVGDGHIFTNKGGCYQPEQLKKISTLNNREYLDIIRV
jgi:hypothetical protein